MLVANSVNTEFIPEQEVEDFILSKGFLTGSRAWGVNESHSDYDYVLYGEDYYEITNKIDKSNNIAREYSGYLNGAYVSLNGKMYNIFTHIKDEVEYIKQTTDILKSFPKDKVYDKKKRVYLFETIRAIMKGI